LKGPDAAAFIHDPEHAPMNLTDAIRTHWLPSPRRPAQPWSAAGLVRQRIDTGERLAEVQRFLGVWVEQGGDAGKDSWRASLSWGGQASGTNRIGLLAFSKRPLPAAPAGQDAAWIRTASWCTWRATSA
jgi:hypothetical protein